MYENQTTLHEAFQQQVAAAPVVDEKPKLTSKKPKFERETSEMEEQHDYENEDSIAQIAKKKHGLCKFMLRMKIPYIHVPYCAK